MNLHAPSNGMTGESDLSQADFERIAQVAKSGWGLNLDKSKRPLIKSRLNKRLRALALPDFTTYCALIEANDKHEIGHFITALTTNVTSFYREVHHFEYLENAVIPDLMARAKRGERVRLWSAGCSSGQEPYSLAGSLLNFDKEACSYDLKILATDIDALVLDKAKRGVYGQDDCTFPSPSHESRVLKRPAGDSHRQVCEALQSLISFRHLNLVDHWPISGKFDVIMCRNVAIYFDKPTQARLWSRFSQCLQPDAYLFIGHSERIADPEEIGFCVAGTTTYRLRPMTKSSSGI
ncbi:protein-glutamate O-methyltransferase [Cognatiyoonia sp. IB215446]|uniref:CheR family methyltransferase n=1 Tax=Cognatiyoonia sp. IB215446 TaxID=3097355 RepID=UPI002A103819|nr:protein-glutamate O-methyltransferase [Cognatiyoonia sp. IB215446]MDX8348588.1 protein-glutamate O-methyltransferase [Cognatiyoonia sp. IB215446]